MHLRGLILWSVVGTGIVSIITQLLTLREFLTQFQGNEITISLTLFCWLLLTGAGSLVARLGRPPSPAFYAFLCLLTALTPLPHLAGIRWLREALFLHGAAPGFREIFLYVLSTIAPYGLLVGYVLPCAQRVLERGERPLESGSLYITDALGDIAGGALFSFLLVHILSPFQALVAGGLVLLGISLLLCVHEKRKGLFAGFLIVGFAVYGPSLSGSLERATLEGQYGRIIAYDESPYGRIVISREGPQHTFWESGLPLYSEGDLVESEEKVHYPLSQCKGPPVVLLVSGGLGEALDEIARHRPLLLDYVELDPELTRLAFEHRLIRSHPFLRILHGDGRRHLKETDTRYDAMILDLPEPDTFQVNRFYTEEFFGLTKRVLKEGGILSFSLSLSENYISDIQREKLSCLYRTAKTHFRDVLVLPGQKAYFLCRDGPLSWDVPGELREKGIATTYISGSFEGNVTEERLRTLAEACQKPVPPNRDFEPLLVEILFEQWFLTHGSSSFPFLLACGVLTLVYLFFIKREELVLFTTGQTAMGVEICVLLSFQILYGYVYLEIGALVTASLLGLLPGAFLGKALKGRSWLLPASEALMLVLLLGFLLWVVFSRVEVPPIVFFGYCFAFSLTAGLQFPAAAARIGDIRGAAARCLAADLWGAALGSVVSGVFLLPLWGVRGALIFFAGIKAASLGILLVSRTGKGGDPWGR